MRGFRSNILCHDAVNVTATNQPRGTRVMRTKRALPILMRIVVTTHNATVARSWLEIPNRGHSELMPPSGSLTPCQRNQPQAPTISPLVSRIEGYQLVRPMGFQMWLRAS